MIRVSASLALGTGLGGEWQSVEVDPSVIVGKAVDYFGRKIGTIETAEPDGERVHVTIACDERDAMLLSRDHLGGLSIP